MCWFFSFLIEKMWTFPDRYHINTVSFLSWILTNLFEFFILQRPDLERMIHPARNHLRPKDVEILQENKPVSLWSETVLKNNQNQKVQKKQENMTYYQLFIYTLFSRTSKIDLKQAVLKYSSIFILKCSSIVLTLQW